MVPTRTTRSSSRRSSILKPPKPRQPLQNLNFNTSSNESSPTCTIKPKRRVSFAEKKHVKEFCNSVEQGTVWDSTYEEHDLSNLKVPCTSNEEHCNVESVSTGNIEVANCCNEFIHISSETLDECCTKDANVQSAPEEILQKDSNVKDYEVTFRCVLEDTESTYKSPIKEDTNEFVLPTDLPLNSESHVCKSFIVYEDPDINLPKKVESSQEINVNYFDSDNINGMSVSNAEEMDLTEIVSNAHSGTNCNETEGVLEHSLELTEVIPTSIKYLNTAKNVQQNIENLNPNCCSSIMSLPNNLNDSDLQIYRNRTQNFNDVSMEITVAVPTKSYNLPVEEFNDVSMEVTKVVEPITRTNMMHQNIVSNTLLIQTMPPNKNDITCIDERTMEMTKAINMQSAVKNNFENSRYNVNAYKTSVNFDKTVIYDNIGMEVTTVIPTVLKAHSDILITESDKTRIFHDNSMTTTAVVSSLNEIDTLPKVHTGQFESESDRTRVFQNNSMTTTAVVSSWNKMNMVQKIQSGQFDSDTDRTRIFHNNSMTTTAVVSCLNKVDTLPKMQSSQFDSETDRTRIFQNKSMTATAVVSSLNKMDTVQKMQSDQFDSETDRTRIFQNNSMTATAVVSCLNKVDTLPKMQSGQFDSETDRTRIFPNKSMTDTAVVSSLNKMDVSEENMTDCEPKTNLDTQELGRPTIFSNISMEMGETIPPLQNTSQMEISTMDTTGIKRAVLSESFKNRTCSTASSRDINVLAVPSPCSSESSDEENRVINNIENVKDDFTEKPIPNDIPDPINIEASMVLHDPLEQHTCASALNENNTEAASAPLNFAPSDSLCTITSDMNHGKCLQAQHSQDVVSHSRRTYTIKSLETDFSFTNSNKERSIIAETNNDIQDKDSCNDQFLIESNGVFFDKNVEELESIKPPSFICLDDLSNEDMPVNTNYDPEINKEAEVNSILDSVKRSEVPEYKKTPVLSKKNVLEEDVDKSRKCLNEGASLDNKLVASRFEFNDPTQFSEIQQLQLPQMDDTDTEVQALECFSLPIDDCKRIPVSDIINDPQHMNVQSISNPKNENMEHSALNANNVYEEISKPNIEDNHVCNDEVKSLSDQPQFFPLEQDVLIELDPFASLMKELRIRAQSDEIIWEVYHENIERKMFIIGFISCSLLIVVYLRDDCDLISDQYVKDIQIISRLTDDADVLISIVHRVILEKLSIKRLMDFYKNSETIPSMLDCVSKEVKLAMDFMFDLKRLESLNMMEISKDSVSFVSCTKKMDIVLRITVNIKPFENIESQDVSVHCLLGSVREEEIKKLITNIKKDHKFLRRFISDVRDYIYLMEESAMIAHGPHPLAPPPTPQSWIRGNFMKWQEHFWQHECYNSFLSVAYCYGDQLLCNISARILYFLSICS